MNSEIESIIQPELLDALKELSEQDILIKGILNKSDTIEKFLNALIAGIICISDRELENADKINALLKSNPKIQELLESQNDKSMLPKSKD